MSDFLDFLNKNSGAFTVVFTMVVAVATVFYAILTRRLVEETERMRLAQTEPSLSVLVEPSEAWINFMLLVVENVGSGPAYDLTFAVSPDFSIDPGQKLSSLGLFKHGLKYLAPKQKLSLFLTSVVDQLEEIQKVGGRFDFEVTVSYRGILGPKRHERFPVDFRHFVGLSTIGTPPLQSIAADIQKIRDTIGHIATGIKRLRVDVFSAEDRERERQALDARRLEMKEAEKKGVEENANGTPSTK